VTGAKAAMGSHLTDPNFLIATHKQDLSNEQIAVNAKAAFAKM